jgi:hypothetical protein
VAAAYGPLQIAAIQEAEIGRSWPIASLDDTWHRCSAAGASAPCAACRGVTLSAKEGINVAAVCQPLHVPAIQEPEMG